MTMWILDPGASSTPPAPSHNVRLDVNGKVNATEFDGMVMF